MCSNWSRDKSINKRKTFNKLCMKIPMEWQIDGWPDCDVNDSIHLLTAWIKNRQNNKAIEFEMERWSADKMTHIYKEPIQSLQKPAPGSNFFFRRLHETNQSTIEKKNFMIIYRKCMSLQLAMNACQKPIFIHALFYFYFALKQINNKSTHPIQMTCESFFVGDFIAWRHYLILLILTTFLISMHRFFL